MHHKQQNFILYVMVFLMIKIICYENKSYTTGDITYDRH